MSETSITIKRLIIKIIHICDVKIGSIIQTVYYLFKYKFDIELIDTKLDQMIKDVKYERRKNRENHLKIMAELQEKREKLQREIDEKFRIERLRNDL